MPGFDLEDVEKVRAMSPKRFRFSDNAAVRNHEARGHYVVGLKFPSLSRLFELETGISTLNGPYGPYKFLTDPDQIEAALAWQEKYRTLIFLRDNLDCSVALDLNLAAAAVYTELGQAEHDAKTSKDAVAIAKLCSQSASAIKRLSSYTDCDVVCAVPPSPDKEWDLPTEIAKRVSGIVGKADMSTQVKFKNKKQSVKTLALADKWKALKAADLAVSTNVNGKRVILLDDKYQSGTTAQFVASKLFEAGAKEVHGLFCVKTWRDTDNA